MLVRGYRDDPVGTEEWMGLARHSAALFVACVLAAFAGAEAAAEDAQYVLDLVELPETTSEAANLGLDLDGDLVADNALGQLIVALLTGADLEPQAAMDAQVLRGDVILLAELRASDLVSSSHAELGVLPGESPSTPPCAGPEDRVCGRHLDGRTSFDVDPGASPDAVLPGSIDAARFRGGPGSVEIELALFGGASIPLRLLGARAEADVTESQLLDGRLGGGVDPAGELLPGLHDALAYRDAVEARPDVGSCP